MGNQPGSFGFSKSETAEQVVKGVDLRGKHVVMTGSSSGLGEECARVFFKKGANVYVLNRNMKKTEESNKKIRERVKIEMKKEKSCGCHAKAKAKTGKDEKCVGKLQAFRCDLSKQESVKAAVKKFKEEVNVKVDMLLLNAGVMATPFSHTMDGYEWQLGINHYGHFTMTMLFLPIMAENSRIQVVSSSAHKKTPGHYEADLALVLDDMHFYKREYSAWQAYGHSKLSNVYFARELNRLLKLSEKNILVNCNHPGAIDTNLGNENSTLSSMRKIPGLSWGMTSLGAFKTIENGASTQMFALTCPKIKEGGIYFQDNDVGNDSERSKDMKIAKQLFKLSVKETGMKYPFPVKDEKEDPNELKDVKSSIPENWKELLEKLHPKDGEKK